MAEKKTVLHIQLVGNIGGIQILCKDISRFSQNENIFYFLFEGGTVADEIAATGSTVYVEHAPHHLFLKSMLRFVRFCKEHKVDVIISHAGAPIVWVHVIFASLFLPNTKIAVYEHGDIVDMVGTGGLKTAVSKWLMIQAIRKSKFVVAVSKFVKQSNANTLKIPLDNVYVVYNGIEPERFHRKETEPHEVFRLIYVGRLFQKKGVHVLLDAVSKLPDNVKYHLDVIGGGPDEEMLKNKAKELSLEEKVTFHGPQKNVDVWLKQADLFTHAAIWEEGFGITLAEAMAASVPCVAFRKGALPELIQNGVNGYIVEETSAEAFAKQIEKCYEKFVSGDYQTLREGARTVGDSFSIEKTVHALEALYKL